MSETVWHPVSSSSVSQLGYNPDTQELHVVHHGGKKTYVYSGVTPEKFEALRSADSIGQHINAHIKGQHEYRAVETHSHKR